MRAITGLLERSRELKFGEIFRPWASQVVLD